MMTTEKFIEAQASLRLSPLLPATHAKNGQNKKKIAVRVVNCQRFLTGP